MRDQDEFGQDRSRIGQIISTAMARITIDVAVDDDIRDVHDGLACAAA
jgi:hypothetical protein